jgi:hypothetical protein
MMWSLIVATFANGAVTSLVMDGAQMALPHGRTADERLKAHYENAVYSEKEKAPEPP